MSNSPLIGEGTWSSPVVPIGKQAPESAPDGQVHQPGTAVVRPVLGGQLEVGVAEGGVVPDGDVAHLSQSARDHSATVIIGILDGELS